MRYFKIYDDLAPEGDLYRFDGKSFQMQSDSGGWGYEHGPSDGKSPEEFLSLICGPGRWEEIDGPEA